MQLVHFSFIFAKTNSGSYTPAIIFGAICLLFAVCYICASIYAKGQHSRDGEIVEYEKKLKAEINEKDRYMNRVIELERKSKQEIEALLIEKWNNANRISTLENELACLQKPAKLQAEIKEEIRNMIELIKRDTVAFPSVSERLLDLWKQLDDGIVARLSNKAYRAKDQVATARELARKWKSDYFYTKTRIEVYEAIAPWLESYMDCTLDEVLEAKKEEDAFSKEELEDSVLRYLPVHEYKSLTEIERNQRALERYWDQRVKRNLWLVGIQYERYIGYLYESRGYKVVYHGALKGVADLGVDIIATKGNTTHVIQCKRYSEIKKIPVRENAIAQIYGAAKVYQYEKGLKKVIPVMITSYELSDEARRFADALNVQVREKIKLEMYPCIKCNINRATGERIYHLPFDQQYDTVVIEKDKGEFYAANVQEAHLRGFRRAYRWRG